MFMCKTSTENCVFYCTMMPSYAQCAYGYLKFLVIPLEHDFATKEC